MINRTGVHFRKSSSLGKSTNGPELLLAAVKYEMCVYREN